MKLPKPQYIALGLGFGLIGLFAADKVAIAMITAKLKARDLSFLDEPPASSMLAAAAEEPPPSDLGEPVPFREIDVLDEEAHSWSNAFSVYGGAGATVFDANGDGRPDIYLTHDGQNWTRATDERGVLLSEPRYSRNILYLHQGLDDNGDPVYARVDELAAANDTFVTEELLVEGFLQPRQSTSDPVDHAGRASSVALAIDLNGDGLQDLWVGNSLFGGHWSHEKTQRILGRFVDPVGREARHSKVPLSGLINHFVAGYTPDDGRDNTRESVRGTEPEGADSLYLNLGDADGDGLPEWRDISREAGIEGIRTTAGLAAADIDLDGDIDLFVAHIMDPDYWPGGAREWAGGANALYVNQLVETGEFKFIEQAAEFGVDGVFDEDYARAPMHRIKEYPFIAPEYAMAAFRFEYYLPRVLEINGEESENAEISWSTVFQDVNQDGYPDLWVANDLGTLRLHLNQAGQGFSDADHARKQRTGMWMTFAPADLDGDLSEDLVVGNMGGSMLNHSFVAPDPWAIVGEPVLTDSLAFGTMVLDEHDPTHAIVSGANTMEELTHTIRHSTVLPPDTSLPNNVRTNGVSGFDLPPFDTNTIDAYEFAWGMTTFDAQNDGRQDLYYLGCLYSRGGGLFPVMGSGPGRLLLNATPAPGAELRLEDQTAEHHLFNIEELQYDRLADEGYIYRASPRQNWRKRDIVYSYDRSAWVAQGPGVQERMVNHDMTQLSENGRAAVSADLNMDGFADLLITNIGGYDSRLSTNQNLRTLVDGVPRVVPPPDHNFHTLTNFEPGRTRLFLNGYDTNHWIAVHLVDPTGHNLDAIGARVVVNGKHLAVKRAGSGGFIGNTSVDLLVGLGSEPAQRIEITWPDAERTQTVFEIDGMTDGTLTVDKVQGVVGFVPAEATSRSETSVP